MLCRSFKKLVVKYSKDAGQPASEKGAVAWTNLSIQFRLCRGTGGKLTGLQKAQMNTVIARLQGSTQNTHKKNFYQREIQRIKSNQTNKQTLRYKQNDLKKHKRGSRKILRQ